MKVVGTPGVPDPRDRPLHHAPNLSGWERPGLLDDLEAGLGPGLVVENDANLAAVGGRACGAARDVDVFVCVTVGTGIGMGIVVDGRLFRGAYAAAGEIGYLPRTGQSEEDGRQRGQVGATAAASVVAMAKQRGLVVESAREVFTAAKSGDERALLVVRDEAEQLAFVVASVVAVMDPELVVLGGGIGSNTDLLQEPMEAALRRMTPLVPRIVASELGDGAVLSGAVAIGLRSARELVFDRRRVVTL